MPTAPGTCTIYALGGETLNGPGATPANVYNRVDNYDLVANWGRLGAVMPTGRHGIFPVLADGRIYVAGGGVQAGGGELAGAGGVYAWLSLRCSDFLFLPVRSKLPLVGSNRMRCPMIARGRVQNGVVVLEKGVHLPEGTEVAILDRGTGPVVTLRPNARPHGVLDIPTVSLGPVLRPLVAHDDMLGEK